MAAGEIFTRRLVCCYSRVARRIAPVRFAWFGCLEPLAAAAVIIDGVGAGAAQIAGGLVGGCGDVDRSQFAGAPEAGEGQLLRW